jgi:TPR repeat protein
MVQLATRHYWGTHGLNQDHHQAFEWYDRARRRGGLAGQMGAAKMLLKGEGVGVDYNRSMR